MTINSLSEYFDQIKNINCGDDEVLLFRGHSNSDYVLQPSVLRDQTLFEKEDIIYHDIFVDYPDEFKKGDHLSNLVKIQHYGSATRLLDVTRNALIALFFAVEDNRDKQGEVIVFKIKKSDFLNYSSDKVLMLSCLPALKYEDKVAIKNWCKANRGIEITDEVLKGHDGLKHLLHEIRSEFPAFETCIDPEHLLNNYFVAAKKDNERMQKQDGAFIIFGLGEKIGFGEKRISVPSSEKDNILKELKLCNIDSSTVYPSFERRLLMLNKNQKLYPTSI